MSLTILGIGTAVPATRMEQHESVQLARVLSSCDDEQGAVLTALYRQTGIASRHIILGPQMVSGFLAGADTCGTGYLPSGPDDLGPDTAERMRLYCEAAAPLALEATRGALVDADVDPATLTHLVTVSCTGFQAPGFDIALIKELELPPTIRRTHVGFMGCHGAFNGLAVARAFATAEPGARVLLCATEICSVHYHYAWNPKRMVGNALFADGAAALVGVSQRDALAGGWTCVANGSRLFPDSEYAMTWSVGNHGFDMGLSARVPGLIAAHLRPWLDEWLAGHGLTVETVGSWAIHPGGPRVLTAIEDTLGLPRGSADVPREVLGAYGNMSSATVLFILDRLRRRGAARPCVALGFGPGLVAEAALFA